MDKAQDRNQLTQGGLQTAVFMQVNVKVPDLEAIIAQLAQGLQGNAMQEAHQTSRGNTETR